ncbi:hypothetical protein [Streptomyces chiangmaiensis]|uniref:Integral membrane protein n=1 Tax=Streptomyces chiangmaiensis TaxID=766497 RepID=A0ABU7FGL9_9ACTN|nr:hypothetical protein [Streptomyces chiangmaiensis]MED7823266.1 hypothetical protein [Streptomyces chiangmaiensis]
MLALRLARGAHPLVQIRRLLVAAASAGTGFLLLCTLGYALGHPEASAGSALRLAWCAVPTAAAVYLAIAVARTDPGTRPRSGLATIGLGPARLMALSTVTTALSTVLGSLLALLVFLHLRGDLPVVPSDRAAAGFLAADQSLPLPAVLTLLALVPLTASLGSALALRPRSERPRRAGQAGDGTQTAASEDVQDDLAPGSPGEASVPDLPLAPRPAPGGLPWGVATLAAGLAVETHASRGGQEQGLHLPGGLAGGPVGVLAGWALTALGLALAGPALAHLCGSLLQTVRPGAVRLLAGRGLQEEARRIGRPLGVVCAVASAAYATAALYGGARPSFGPLTVVGAVLVTGCALATLATAAVETRQARADTIAALVRLGAPATVLRTAALLRAGALVVVFVPVTWAVAELAAMPLAR